MKSLEKWQFISLVSRLTAMGVGLVQTAVIIRILHPAEWGIVQIGMAWGAAFGIYQHLGLASGSTREISTSKDDADVFKIFVTAASIRYLVTIPIAVFLFFTAEKVAIGQYSQGALVVPIKIYAFIVLILGIKSLFNSVIAGTKRFKALFIYQAAITIVSISLFIPLVYFHRIDGYFYAKFLFELIAMLVLAVVAFKPLKGKLQFPSKADYVRLIKQLSPILFAVYVVKVFVTQWENSGTLLLGRDVSPEVLAVFAFALLFSKKLMHVSDAVTDVNLPILSGKYVSNVEEFKELFKNNLNKVFSFMVFSAFSAVFWSRELVYVFTGPNSIYEAAFPLLIPMIFTFIFYGLINIIKSSIFIPAKFIKELIAGYALMFGTTVTLYFLQTRYFALLPVQSMITSLVLGSVVGFVILVLTSQIKLNFTYFSYSHFGVLLLTLVIMLAKDIEEFWLKIPVYLILSATYLALVYFVKFVTKDDLARVYSKFSRLIKI